MIVNGRHHARGPRLLFPMQGSFSFIKTCAFRKSYPDIMVVQPGQDRDGYNDPGPLHCFRRNVFQPCDGDPPFTMYFETVDWATSKRAT